MKKKILAIVLCATLCFGVTGCGTGYYFGEDNFSHIDNEYMKMHKLYDENDGCIIAYDEYTKVMYLCVYGDESVAITPIYNSDGTVKLYEEADIASTEETNITSAEETNFRDIFCDEVNRASNRILDTMDEKAN